MALTRRNTLILLFTVVAAAGLIGGTGAFSSVEADRTVTVSTASDSDANVQFDVDPEDKFDTLDDEGDDVIALDFDNINLDANTTYKGALNVTVNSAAAGEYDIGVSNTPPNIAVEFADGSTELTDVDAGDSKQVDIIIDTDGITDNSTDVDGDESLTFSVDRS